MHFDLTGKKSFKLGEFTAWYDPSRQFYNVYVVNSEGERIYSKYDIEGYQRPSSLLPTDAPDGARAKVTRHRSIEYTLHTVMKIRSGDYQNITRYVRKDGRWVRTSEKIVNKAY